MSRNKIIFMGTPDISSIYLQSLIDNKFNIVSVYSQPARKKDRGLVLQQSPVQKLAIISGIEVLTPTSLNNNKEKEILKKINPDLIVVMGYGIKLPNFFLNIPKYGSINIHISLLPRWRGASPIEHAILNGDKETGVTIFKIEEEMDAGPKIISQNIPIEKNINKDDLIKKLNLIGIDLLKTILPKILNNEISFEKQDLNKVTYAPKIFTELRKIDFNQNIESISNMIRAFSIKPSAWFFYNNERIKIIKSSYEKGKFNQSCILNSNFHIGCLDGKICPEILQREGRKAMVIEDFLRGFKFEIGKKIND